MSKNKHLQLPRAPGVDQTADVGTDEIASPFRFEKIARTSSGGRGSTPRQVKTTLFKTDTKNVRPDSSNLVSRSTGISRAKVGSPLSRQGLAASSSGSGVPSPSLLALHRWLNSGPCRKNKSVVKVSSPRPKRTKIDVIDLCSSSSSSDDFCPAPRHKRPTRTFDHTISLPLTPQHKQVTKQNVNTRTHSQTTSGKAVSAQIKLTCDFCKGGPFKGNAGLSQHLRVKHSYLSHDLSAKSHVLVKRRWSQEEKLLLAEAEADLIRQGIKFVNDPLTAKFPRTKESIKKQRQSKGHKQLVRSFLDSPKIDAPASSEFVSSPPNSFVDSSLKSALVVRSAPANPKFMQLNGEAILRDRDNLDSYFDDWLVSSKLVKSGSATSGRPNSSSFTDKSSKFNRRDRRRYLRAVWLRAFEKHPSRTAKRILDGGDPFDRPQKLPPNTNEFWLNQFSPNPTSSCVKPPKSSDFSTSNEVLMAPITIGELKDSYDQLRKSSPGLDRIGLKDLAPHMVALVDWFNIFVVIRDIPSALKQFYTTLIPKKESPNSPGDFRPISVGSFIRRLFSKILDSRIKAVVCFHQAQRGFKPEEGCAIQTHILRAVVNDHISNLRPLNYMYLDVRKAFDSIDHSVLPRVFRANGLPFSLCQLLCNVYRGNTTRISGIGSPIPIGRGVLQGDPLSPTVFNMVLEVVNQNLRTDLGVNLGGVSMNHLLYADDTVLMTETPQGLQKLAEDFTSLLGEFGLSCNPDKCRSVSICVNGKRKKWYVNSAPVFRLQGEFVKPLRILDSYSYLGVQLRASGVAVSQAIPKLSDMLPRLTKSVLKPQSKMQILRSVLAPRLMFDLTMSTTSVRTLHSIDRRIRAFVRRTLHFPRDTPNSVIHSAVRYGGLGIASMRSSITSFQLLQIRRIERIENDPPVSSLIGSTYWAKFRERVRRNVRYFFDESDLSLFCRTSHREWWKDQLYSSVDGGGLRHYGSATLRRNAWITDSNRIKCTGREYICAMQVKYNSLATRERSTRGRIDSNQPKLRMCPSCPDKLGTLAHLLQVCGRTQLLRIDRHNAVVQVLNSRLKSIGYCTYLEPRLDFASTWLQPDIIAHKPNSPELYIIDPTIVSDGFPLAVSYEKKINKYTHNSLVNHIVKKLKLNTRSDYGLCVIPVVLSWRGCWADKSIKGLEAIGVGSFTLELITFKALVAGRGIYTADRLRTDV